MLVRLAIRVRNGEQMVEQDTPHADEVRRTVNQLLEEARQQGSLSETQRIEWRGGTLDVPVVTVRVIQLNYNPQTHRIRAQRTLDPRRDAELSQNPYAAASQAYLEELLKADPADPTRQDPAYQELRDDLKENGQHTPGLITRSGILVNGNTRCAALRDNGEDFIRVGVLPEVWTYEDLSAVELSIQLRREFRRDYSFVNYLLTVDELIASGKSEADVGEYFRQLPKTVRRALWISARIRDLIDRSSRLDGVAPLRLVDFENHKGKLEEMYNAWLAASADPDQAEKLVESRLAGLLLRGAKTDLRVVGPDFHQKYLMRRLPDEAKTDTTAGADVEVPGLGISVPGASKDLAQVVGFTEVVTRAFQREQSGQKPRDGEPGYQDLVEAFRTARIKAGADDTLRQKKDAPADKIRDAAEELDLARDALVTSVSQRVVEREQLLESLRTLREALSKLSTIVWRTVEDPEIEWMARLVNDD
jgi:hypothetical protein